MRLWEARGVVRLDVGDKVGCGQLTTVRCVEMPTVTNTQRVRLAILAALETPKAMASEVFQVWAKKWLGGEDRSWRAARACWAATPMAMATATEMAAGMATATEMAAGMATRMEVPMWLSAVLVRTARECSHSVDFATLAERAVREEIALRGGKK
jgi:hypothetical protein